MATKHTLKSLGAKGRKARTYKVSHSGRVVTYRSAQEKQLLQQSERLQKVLDEKSKKLGAA